MISNLLKEHKEEIYKISTEADRYYFQTSGSFIGKRLKENTWKEIMEKNKYVLR